VDSVTATQVVATLEFGTSPVDVGDEWTVEFGPDLSGEPLPLLLVADEGQVNQGNFPVGFLGGVTETGPSFELGLERPLVRYAELGHQPHTFTGTVGRQHVRFTTQSRLLDSALAVLDTPARALLFTSAPSAVGTTEWFSLPSSPAAVDTGDYLELHDNPVATPTQVFEVVRTGTGPNVLRLGAPVGVQLGPWALTQNSAPPYGRVRKRKQDNYDVLKAGLVAWVAANPDRYYAELRRLLNPLVVNSNPKLSDVNAAVLHLQQLSVQFTTLLLYLNTYEAPLVEEVNVLLDTYLQQGARRAADILLEPDLPTFFGLDQDEASYAGDVQKAIRAVNMQDLPQSKVGRSSSSVLVDEYEETDYEFDLSDVVDEEVPVPGYSSEFIGSAF
jgi:hypothetical protein